MVVFKNSAGSWLLPPGSHPIRKLSRTPWTSSISAGQPSSHKFTADYYTDNYGFLKYNTAKSPYIAPKLKKITVFDMLECAKECGRRPEASTLTFDDVCRFASELKKTPNLNKAVTQSRPLEKDGVALQRKTPNMTKIYGDCEVFLGGSCNPTTWRKDVAIPTLNDKGISFYNPQVAHWRPELLEQEFTAKEKASLLFFVLDNQTRSVSALIEVAQIAGQNRKLILVIQSYTQKSQSICGEPITLKEYEDLREGQSVVKRLVEKQGIPVFERIEIALNFTEKMLRENMSIERFKQFKANNSRLNDSIIRSKFNKLNPDKRGKIRLDDAWTGACDLVNDQSLSRLSGDDVTEDISYEKFCDMVRDQEYRRSATESYDVVMFGSDKDTLWRDDIAIPILQKEELSWYAPQSWCSESDEISKAMENSSSVLLFVITNKCRGIATMAMAGYCIGRGKKVVLCVQQLPSKATIGNEELTTLAVKDYNRGRIYLSDLAKRASMPVFSNIVDAVKCAANMSRVIQKC